MSCPTSLSNSDWSAQHNPYRLWNFRPSHPVAFFWHSCSTIVADYHRPYTIQLESGADNWRHHRKLCLPPPPRPRHLMLSIQILPCQVRPAGRHTPFRCGPVSFFFSAARLPRMQMGTNTTASTSISYLHSVHW